MRTADIRACTSGTTEAPFACEPLLLYKIGIASSRHSRAKVSKRDAPPGISKHE